MTTALAATTFALPARTAGQDSPGQAPGDAGDLFSLLLAGLFPNGGAASVAQIAGAEVAPPAPGFSNLLPPQLTRVSEAVNDAERSPRAARASILPLASDDLPSSLLASPGQAAPGIAPLGMPDGSSRPTEAAPILAMAPSLPSSLPPIELAAPAADAHAAVADEQNPASIETAPRSLPATARSPLAPSAQEGSPNVEGDEALAATSPKPASARPLSLTAPARTDAVGEEPAALPDQPADPAIVRADATRAQTPSPRAGLVQVLALAEAASATGPQVQRIDETADRSAWDGRAAASLDRMETPSGRVERATLDLPALPARPHTTAPVLQIGHQILRAATHRVERMLVQLEPAALGRVEVRLDFGHEGKVSALIATDRPETLDVLQRDARTLERSLEQAGLRLDSGGLSFALKRDGGHGQPFSDVPWSELAGDPDPPKPGVDQEAQHGRPAILTLRLLDLHV